jgi:hypothetical protein
MGKFDPNKFDYRSVEMLFRRLNRIDSIRKIFKLYK